MNSHKTDPSTNLLPDSSSIPFNDSTRCLYRYANGKRCRLAGSQPHFGLCPHHFSLAKPTASLELYNDAEDLSADLLPQLSELSPSIDLRQFLARLLTLVTKGRVSPPFSLTSPISSFTLIPAITLDDDSAARWNSHSWLPFPTLASLPLCVIFCF